MEISYEDIKKRIFGLDVLATSYDDRNRPIGARKLPTPITVCMQRIRNEYAAELKICDSLIADNIKENVKHNAEKPVTKQNDKGVEVYVFKSGEAEIEYRKRVQEIMSTKTKCKDHQIHEEDILRMDFLEEWVYAGIKWMVKSV